MGVFKWLKLSDLVDGMKVYVHSQSRLVVPPGEYFIEHGHDDKIRVVQFVVNEVTGEIQRDIVRYSTILIDDVGLAVGISECPQWLHLEEITAGMTVNIYPRDSSDVVESYIVHADFIGRLYVKQNDFVQYLDLLEDKVTGQLIGVTEGLVDLVKEQTQLSESQLRFSDLLTGMTIKMKGAIAYSLEPSEIPDGDYVIQFIAKSRVINISSSSSEIWYTHLCRTDVNGYLIGVSKVMSIIPETVATDVVKSSWLKLEEIKVGMIVHYNGDDISPGNYTVKTDVHNVLGLYSQEAGLWWFPYTGETDDQQRIIGLSLVSIPYEETIVVDSPSATNNISPWLKRSQVVDGMMVHVDSRSGLPPGDYHVWRSIDNQFRIVNATHTEWLCHPPIHDDVLIGITPIINTTSEKTTEFTKEPKASARTWIANQGKLELSNTQLAIVYHPGVDHSFRLMWKNHVLLNKHSNTLSVVKEMAMEHLAELIEMGLEA